LDTPHDSVIRPDRLLLATDGSKDAMLASRVATDLSLRTGARLHVAHAWYHLVEGLAYPTLVWADYSNLYEREARKILEAQVDAVEAADCAIAQSHLLHGPPIDAILDLCEELRPGLVIVGSRGLGPVRRMFVGSVSEGVVHHARCPVLVVRGGEELGAVMGGRPGTRLVDADATLALLQVAEEGRKTLLAVGSRGLGAMGRAARQRLHQRAQSSEGPGPHLLGWAMNSGGDRKCA
jgi:nucleotide-binding universal stress UspA family protein